MQFLVKRFARQDTEAQWLVFARENNNNDRILLGDLLGIEEKEYEQVIRDYNGIPYCMSNFATFVKVDDAYTFINKYLIPQAVAAKLKGAKFQ